MVIEMEFYERLKIDIDLTPQQEYEPILIGLLGIMLHSLTFWGIIILSGNLDNVISIRMGNAL